MQHAAIDNQTPYAFEHLFMHEEHGRPVVVSVVQATFGIVEDASRSPASHRLELLEAQPPVQLGGERWESILPDDRSPDPPGDDPEVVSYRFEPCMAFFKPATDVVLVGHALAPSSDTTQMKVGLKVGALEKLVQVYGERMWLREGGEMVATKPLAFERIPLRYERAFGGWDRRDADPDKHRCYAPNPVGVGYQQVKPPKEDADEAEDEAEELEPIEGLRLPNIEDPADPLKRYGQLVAPAGFGFLSPHWEPRCKLIGTYDEAWMEERMPYLAADFDRRFFNAASPGLIADGYLTGHEPVVVFGVAPKPMIFALPGVRAPTCTVERIGCEDAVLAMPLDTVHIDSDRHQLTLSYRAHALLRDGPRDVRSVRIARGD